MSETTCKLAIGTVQFGMPYGITNQNGQVHQNEVDAILNLACDNGVTTLDTAKIYGTSEAAIGSYLQNHSEHSWEIVTKINDCYNKLPQQIEDSKVKLTIRPTSILAHSAELFLNLRFQAELRGLKEKKLIDKTGVSLYNESEINKVLESNFKPDIIQLPLNILDTRLYHHGILAHLAGEGIEVHARSVFLQGLFYLSKNDLKTRFPDAAPLMEKLETIASKAGLILSELSLLWLMRLKEVDKVIIGVENTSQLRDHFRTLKKDVDDGVFEEALSVQYENEIVLNPSLWP